MHQRLQQELARDPSYPLAPSWIRSTWYHRVAAKAREVEQATVLVQDDDFEVVSDRSTMQRVIVSKSARSVVSTTSAATQRSALTEMEAAERFGYDEDVDDVVGEDPLGPVSLSHGNMKL